MMTDQAILTEIQYALLEPPDGGQSWPSEVWTRAEVLALLNAGQWRLQRETQLSSARTTIAVLAAATSVPLPADWVATLHAVWQDTTTGARTPLSPADTMQADLAIPTWNTIGGTPLTYQDRESTSRTLRLAPIPAANGTLDLLYVPRAATLTGGGTSFAIADEFTYGAKWHAISGLLDDVGRLQDPPRAAYAERRTKLLILLADLLLRGGA